MGTFFTPKGAPFWYRIVSFQRLTVSILAAIHAPRATMPQARRATYWLRTDDLALANIHHITDSVFCENKLQHLSRRPLGVAMGGRVFSAGG
jgi:hypothetical protein